MHVFYKDFIYLFFRERRREGEREGEKHRCAVAPHLPPTGDLARNPGTCPDWNLNRQHFGSQVHTQPSELHQSGPYMRVLIKDKTDAALCLHIFV